MLSKRRHRRAAFTLIETLLAVTITAVLLTAVAIAFNASVISYNTNEDIFKAVNNARQAASRITTQLRSATAVDANAPSNECTMEIATGEDITYRYDSTDGTLYLVTNDDGTDDDYVLCENVANAVFTKNTFVNDEGLIAVKSVQLTMTVNSGGVQQKVAAAAVVRRNLD